MGILSLYSAICTTSALWGQLFANMWLLGRHQGKPAQGIATPGNVSLLLLCTYILVFGHPLAFNESLQWQDWNRLLTLWQPGYCQEELGSAGRCYDAGCLLKGKNNKRKIRDETENKRQCQKSSEDETGSSKYIGKFLRLIYFESLVTEDIAKNCFSDIPS